MTQTADAITTEIIRNILIAASEEMKTNLVRTAYTPIIYEMFDFTVGLFDAEGDMISIGLGLPMFVRGMSDVIKAMLDHWGRDRLHPGDVLLTNDAYVTGSHLNHMTFVVPVFDGDALIGFSACMAHWPDVGGTLGLSLGNDIYSEGLQMPFVKAWKRGVMDEEIIDIIKINVRRPDHAMGDMRAQVAAVRTGERHLLEIVRKYGRETYLAAVQNIYAQSEALARQGVLSIPDGVYEAESFMDDDGVDLGKRISLKVRVIVAGDRMTIDLSELNTQVRGYYNSGATAGLSCAGVAFKCLTSPVDYPLNAGSFRPLDVILPPGKVLSAVKPAPMRLWMIYPMTVIDTVFKALAKAVPDRVIAGHHADLVIGACICHSGGQGRMMPLGLMGGGWGAKHNEDGVSATICINDGDTHNNPVEAAEAKDPILVERYALREDSGGAGEYRGGLGTEMVFRPLEHMHFDAGLERVKCRPWGLFGGLSAMGNEVAVQRSDEPERVFESGKISGIPLDHGDTCILRSGGGGGFGSPLARPVARVVADVQQGYVSQEAARKYYGVVIDPVHGVADEAATRVLRAEMQAQSLPVDEPDAA